MSIRYVLSAISGLAWLCFSCELIAASDLSADAAHRSLLEQALKIHRGASGMHHTRAAGVSDRPTGRVIVRLKPGSEVAATTTGLATSRADVALLRTIQLPQNVGTGSAGPRQMLVLQSFTLSTEQLMTELKQDPAVEVVEPDYVVHAEATMPDDSRFGDLWGMDNTGQTLGMPDADIDAPEAWDRLTGNGSVIVGSIDSGVDYNHPDLAANMWRNIVEANGSPGVDDDANGYVDDIFGIDTVNGDSDPMDDAGHGTHTAGTIGAVGNNAEGVAGVAWNVKLAACKFLDASGSGYTSGAIECLNYFTALKQRGENIVATNASWGGGEFVQLLKDAIDASGASGTLFIAAAGNHYGHDNDVEPHYPSSYESASIIAVAASDASDELAFFSNHGATSVDLGAPGSYTLSTGPSTLDCELEPANAALFHDGFESGLGAWSLFGTRDYRTAPIFGDPEMYWVQEGSEQHSGEFSASDSAGMSLPYSLSSATTAADLSGAVDAQLCAGVWVKGDAGNGVDWMDAYISRDGGVNWSIVLSTTGPHPDWTRLTFPIPRDHANSDFRLGLVRINESATARDGYYLDDVGIDVADSFEHVGHYDWKSGTSMAVPHVSGAVALVAMAFPGEGLEARKARILNSVDPLPSLDGKVLTGGRLNLANALGEGTDNLLGWPDLNGDARADILWRNYTSGRNFVSFMSGDNRTGAGELPAEPDLEMHIAGTPDLNGDGDPDILWQNSTRGGTAVWFMDGTRRIGTAIIGSSERDPNWRVAGTPDLNGDGKPDILWRYQGAGDDQGKVVVWYMNGTVLTSAAGVAQTYPDLNWRIVGTPDLNYDGKPDILWRYHGEGVNPGEMRVWFMHGTTRVGESLLSPARRADLHWRVVATPDIDRDGKPDIVWRYYGPGTSQGRIAVWFMDGTKRIGGRSLFVRPDTSWRIVNNGDF
jgi:subtilisin family serine protease